MPDDFAELRGALERASAEYVDVVRTKDLFELLDAYDSYRLQAQIDGSDAYDPDYDREGEKRRLLGDPRNSCYACVYGLKCPEHSTNN